MPGISNPSGRAWGNGYQGTVRRTGQTAASRPNPPSLAPWHAVPGSEPLEAILCPSGDCGPAGAHIHPRRAPHLAIPVDPLTGRWVITRPEPAEPRRPLPPGWDGPDTRRPGAARARLEQQ